MKGKLIKENEDYHLQIVDEKLNVILISSTNISTNQLINPPYKLSIKNCQAIESGYDLEELTEEKYQYDSDMTNIEECFVDRSRQEFKAGFQKALEILGEKRFTEEDMMKFMQYIITNEELENTSSVSPSTAKYYVDKFCNKIQQTEWDVEIVMEEVHTLKLRRGNTSYMGKPKLNSQGCLILKLAK